MSKTMRVILLGLLISVIASTPLLAQDHSRNWDNGYVLGVTEVHTKDGMFNAYINDLSNVWRRFLEEQMKDGSVIGYNMYSNASPRQGEPDLYLVVTYANWAAFDRGEEYFNSIRDKVIGSAEDMREAGVKRGDLRTIGTQRTLVEIKFRD
jgi:hypothetical protein